MKRWTETLLFGSTGAIVMKPGKIANRQFEVPMTERRFETSDSDLGRLVSSEFDEREQASQGHDDDEANGNGDTV